MVKHYDVAVIGLGIMGSAVTLSLARRGLSVVAAERYWAGHDRGSSHGRTRLIRRAHFEDPGYAPLVNHAYELWHEAEQASNRTLFLKTGALVIGSEKGALVPGTRQAIREHRLPHHALNNSQLRARYPWLRLRQDEVGILEQDAGILLAEDCVASLQQLAVKEGAQLRFGAECVFGNESFADTQGPIPFEINGETVLARQLVVAAGPWTPGLFPPGLIPKLDVERVATYWSIPRLTRESFEWRNLPVMLWDHAAAPFCIFPEVDGQGVKLAFHHSGIGVDANSLDRTIQPHEIANVRSLLDKAAPILNGGIASSRVCMYTNTRDGHFAIGAVGGSRVMIVSACSGHGFKFAPVIGEIVTDLVTDGATSYPSELWRLDRPGLYPRSEAVPTGDAAAIGEEGFDDVENPLVRSGSR